MDDQRTWTARRRQEAVPEPRERSFLLAGYEPLPEGLEGMEAANVAY